jgi:hypothetical protein
MNKQPLSRRQLIAAVATLGAGSAVVTACFGNDSGSDGSDGAVTAGNGETIDTATAVTTATTSNTEVVDPAFASPWRSLANADMTALGRAVRAQAPSALAHAQQRLTSGDVSDTRKVLADAYLQDAREGAFVDVDTWQLPATLAGLAAGLSLLAEQS